MNSEQLKKVCEKLESYRDEMVEFQRDITAQPALSPKSGGEGEWKKTRVIEKYLKKFGAESIQIVEIDDPAAPEKTRPNIIVRNKGQKSDRTVWVMSHMDIVPPGDLKEWKSDPYKVRVEGGKIYGRGVEDNQQALTASVFVLRAFKELGIKTPHDFGLVIVADEETGSEFGIKAVLKKSKEFRKEDLVLVPDLGSPNGEMLEVAEKSILWINFLVKGKSAHGSTPQKGINAHLAGCELILNLHQKLYQKFNKKDPLYDPPISTFEPTKKETNQPNINAIPAEDRFSFDCRIMPEYKLAEVKEFIQGEVRQIEKKYGVQISQEFPQNLSAAPATSIEAPVVKALVKAVKEIAKVEPKIVGVGGGTVAAYFREAGIPAVCWGILDETLHAPNEYCVIDNMVKEAKVYAHVVLQD